MSIVINDFYIWLPGRLASLEKRTAHTSKCRWLINWINLFLPENSFSAERGWKHFVINLYQPKTDLKILISVVGCRRCMHRWNAWGSTIFYIKNLCFKENQIEPNNTFRVSQSHHQYCAGWIGRPKTGVYIYIYEEARPRDRTFRNHC